MAHQDFAKVAFGLAAVLITALYFGARFFINHRGSPTARLAVKTYSNCLLLRDKHGDDNEQYIKCIKNELDPLVNELIATEEIKLYRCKPNQKDSNTAFCKVWVWWIPREVLVTNKELVDKINNIKGSGNKAHTNEDIRFTLNKGEEKHFSEMTQNIQQPTNIGNLGTEQSSAQETDGYSQTTQITSQASHLPAVTQKPLDSVPEDQSTGQEVNGLPSEAQVVESLIDVQSSGQEKYNSETLGIQGVGQELSSSSPGAPDTTHEPGITLETEVATQGVPDISKNKQEVHELTSDPNVDEEYNSPETQSTGQELSPSSNLKVTEDVPVSLRETQAAAQELDDSSPETQKQKKSQKSDSLHGIQSELQDSHLSSTPQSTAKESDSPAEKETARQTAGDLSTENLDDVQVKHDLSSGKTEVKEANVKAFVNPGTQLPQQQLDDSNKPQTIGQESAISPGISPLSHNNAQNENKSPLKPQDEKTHNTVSPRTQATSEDSSSTSSSESQSSPKTKNEKHQKKKSGAKNKIAKKSEKDELVPAISPPQGEILKDEEKPSQPVRRKLFNGLYFNDYYTNRMKEGLTSFDTNSPINSGRSPQHKPPAHHGPDRQVKPFLTTTSYIYSNYHDHYSMPRQSYSTQFPSHPLNYHEPPFTFPPGLYTYPVTTQKSQFTHTHPFQINEHSSLQHPPRTSSFYGSNFR